MSTIVLRSVKGTPLTNTEVDDNFSNLNTDKIQIGGTYSSGTASGVLFLNGSKVLTTGSALTFDGASLGVNGVSVGRGAGAVATNTAVGASALSGSNTGAYLTAVGYRALATNTSGQLNVAVGRIALESNTTGTDSTAVGDGALQANTTGSYNTSVGRQALQNNTTANNNTAVGYQAGYANTTGGDAVFVGRLAGWKNTTGGGNVCIGNSAGRESTTGSQSVYVGNIAGSSVTTGTQNTFVGGFAGYLCTTASNNTILGRFNGNQGGLDIRTANNHIVLSDGDGNPRIVVDSSARVSVGGGVVGGAPLSVGSSGQPAGVGAIRVAPAYESSKYFSALQLWPSDTSGRLDYAGMFLGSITANNGMITSGSYYDFTGNHIPSGTSATMISMAGSTVGIYATAGLTVGNSFTPVQVGQFNAYGMGLANATPTSGTGITFPATQNASSNANTLDDYEEGTWTPEIRLGGSTTGITYNTREGTYKKVGSLVYCSCVIALTSKGSQTGALTLNGFPFTTASANASRGGGGFTYFHNTPSLSNCGSLLLLVESSDTRSVLRYYNTSTGLSTELTQSNINDATEFFFSFTYNSAS